VRRSACTRVCLCQRSTLLLLLLRLRLLCRSGTEERGRTESSRLCGVRGLVCACRLLRRASEAAKEAARLRRRLRCRCSAEETSCRRRRRRGRGTSWLCSQCAAKKAAAEPPAACWLCCACGSTGSSSKQAVGRRRRRCCRLAAEERERWSRGPARGRLVASNVAEKRHVDSAVARSCQKFGRRVVLPRARATGAKLLWTLACLLQQHGEWRSTDVFDTVEVTSDDKCGKLVDQTTYV
jgi:hypothetical protein